jgi:hypothetical protein
MDANMDANARLVVSDAYVDACVAVAHANMDADSGIAGAYTARRRQRDARTHRDAYTYRNASAGSDAHLDANVDTHLDACVTAANARGDGYFYLSTADAYTLACVLP